MLFRWKLNKFDFLLRTPPFNVVEKNYTNPENFNKFSAFVLDLPDWVNIIGINKEGEILLIKQFRFGTDKIELEIPGGIVEKNESPEEAALREFKEETGYTIKNLELLGKVDANPAIMNNSCYTFLGKIAGKGEVSFDPNEIIESEFTTPTQVRKYLKEGQITNAYVVAAFLWYLLKNHTLE